jgi:hypothetical protein
VIRKLRPVSWLAVLSFTALAAWATLPGEPERTRAAFPGFNGDIVFDSDRFGAEQIFRIPAAGGEAVQLTEGPRNYSPAWSPDGTQIAFVSDRDGNSEIYVMNADGGEETRLTNTADPESDPAWSADGGTIAFRRRVAGDPQIWTVPAAGGAPGVLINSAGYDYAPKFSPDGTRIAYHHNEPAGDTDVTDTEIHVADVDGSNPVPVTDNDSHDFTPDWSPDSNRLVYTCEFGTASNEVCVVDANGSDQHSLTPGSNYYNEPVWSPDGQRIVFYDYVNPSAIYTMDSSGGDVQPVTAEGDYEPDWQPLGEPPPQQVAWGDHNCSGSADPVDGLLTLRHDAGLPAETNECPEMGEQVQVDGVTRTWGDIDCSGAADPVDGLKVLRFDAGLDVARPPSCPGPGETVIVVQI